MEDNVGNHMNNPNIRSKPSQVSFKKKLVEDDMNSNGDLRETLGQ